jgi:hypothetical protein
MTPASTSPRAVVLLIRNSFLVLAVVGHEGLIAVTRLSPRGRAVELLIRRHVPTLAGQYAASVLVVEPSLAPRLPELPSLHVALLTIEEVKAFFCAPTYHALYTALLKGHPELARFVMARAGYLVLTNRWRTAVLLATAFGLTYSAYRY